MRIEQKQFKENMWLHVSSEKLSPESVHLVFCFGATQLIKQPERYEELTSWYPQATIVMSSTSGEIIGTSVDDDTLSVTAIHFDDTTIRAHAQNVDAMEQSMRIGEELARQLPHENLVHVMVFSDGLRVNGSELVKGINSVIPEQVALTGGLAGDKDKFSETYVGLNGPAEQNQIAVIGFYGQKLHVGHGSVGGWDPFGAERIVTKSSGNVVYELDNQPILDLYKEYLGDKASGLPGTGLLFPLNIREPDSDVHLVRTLLGVNEADKSITYAGDVPVGSYAQLMKANFERLVEGAENAAKMSHESMKEMQAELAILISCVGRKLVLKQSTEEEVESVQDALGEQCAIAGFYSYGEIAPSSATSNQCELHNQTMTITTFREE